MIAKSEYKYKTRHYRVGGPKALAAVGKPTEAIQYAEDSKGLNAPLTTIAAFCEGVLLDTGFADEAYTRYAVEATLATTNLATFEAIVKEYPHMPRGDHSCATWFQVSRGKRESSLRRPKDSELFELAIELANPRTLIRAARD